jgi:hypothetical protein
MSIEKGHRPGPFIILNPAMLALLKQSFFVIFLVLKGHFK